MLTEPRSLTVESILVGVSADTPTDSRTPPRYRPNFTDSLQADVARFRVAVHGVTDKTRSIIAAAASHV